MSELKAKSDWRASFRSWLGTDAPIGGPLEQRLVKAYGAMGKAPSQDSEGGSVFSTPVDELLFSVSQELQLKPKPFWPEGKPWAICITHDMDRVLSTIQRAKRLSLRPDRALQALAQDLSTASRKSRWRENPYFNFEAILALQRSEAFHSALYVLFERRRWMRSVFSGEWQHTIGVYQPAELGDELKKFAAAGNEVGIHGSFDSFADGKLLQAEREQLLSFGVPSVVGIRNHYLNYDEKRTPRAQTDAGLLYDSTMGFNFRSGFRVGTCFPYLNHGVWELPFQLMDTALRFQFRDLSSRKGAANVVTDRVAERGGVLVLNWHTHVMNSRYFPEEMELLVDLIHRAKREGAWFATPREVVERWSTRYV